MRVLIYYLLGINLLTFFIYGIDNGMFVFHHKTKHKKFLIGVPLILLAQLALAYLLLVK